jgi:1-acyl-sn-glycerol-3-phosphate acyltransferase
MCATTPISACFCSHSFKLEDASDQHARPLIMKYVDLAKSIEESDSDFLKKFPPFFVRWLEKVIKQKEMNIILNKYIHCEGVDFHRAIIKEFNITLDVEGLENLPDRRKCFFVSNHPFGVIDGLILTKTVLEKYGDLKAIGSESFQHVPNLRPYIAMVNPYGMSPRKYVAEMEKVFRSDIAITHFPAGNVSRRYHGEVLDKAWQKSFISRAIACQRDIVPFYFHGGNSNLFYGIHWLRQLFGIQLTLELALLPREMLLKQNQTVRYTIGKPIPWQTFDSSHTHVEWAQKVRAHVYKMAGKNGSKLDF